jgi:hypothetical protein
VKMIFFVLQKLQHTALISTAQLRNPVPRDPAFPKLPAPPTPYAPPSSHGRTLPGRHSQGGERDDVILCWRCCTKRTNSSWQRCRPVCVCVRVCACVCGVSLRGYVTYSRGSQQSPSLPMLGGVPLVFYPLSIDRIPAVYRLTAAGCDR